MSAPCPQEHVFIGKFLVASGGVMSNGKPIDNVSLQWNADPPFTMITVHIEPAHAIALGKALIAHGERVEKSS